MRAGSHHFRAGLVRIGQPLSRAGEVTFEILDLGWKTARSSVFALASPSVVIERFLLLVYRTAPLVFITSFATGAALALQFGQGMARFGGKLYVPNILAIAIVKALGPVFACLMIAARAGGGIAAEIGAMKVTQQLDALKALGSDPVQKLVAPSVLALMLGGPFLAFISDFSGILGGLLAGMGSLGIAPALYLEKTMNSIREADVVIGLVKTAVFGGGVALIGSYCGLRTKTGTAGIGVATTAAIVAANVFVLVADLIVTKLIWVLQS